MMDQCCGNCKYYGIVTARSWEFLSAGGVKACKMNLISTNSCNWCVCYKRKIVPSEAPATSVA